jgi:hypothetical protein
LITGEVFEENVYYNRPGVAVVKWDATSKAVYVEWQGWADPTEFAALSEAGLRALTEHHGSRWLGDLRHMKAIQQSDQDWASQNWFPRVLAAGLRRMALVIPTSGIAKANLEAILGRVQGEDPLKRLPTHVPGTNMGLAYFATVKEARDWLTGPLTVPPAVREGKPTI